MFISTVLRKVSRGNMLVRAVVAFIILTCGATVTGAQEKPKSGLTLSEPTAYLVLDMPHRKMVVELDGVPLREYSFTVLSDSVAAEERCRDLVDGSSVELKVQNITLLSAAETIPESELQIIAEDAGLAPGQVQRYMPGEMVLEISRGLRVYVETDCPNTRSYPWKQMKDILRRIGHFFTPGLSMRLGLSAEDAMSLYGFAIRQPQVTIR